MEKSNGTIYLGLICIEYTLYYNLFQPFQTTLVGMELFPSSLDHRIMLEYNTLWAIKTPTPITPALKGKFTQLLPPFLSS